MVASQLHRCLARVPQGVWLKHFLDSDSEEKRALVQDIFTLQQIRRDALALFNNPPIEMQGTALDVLEELGAHACLSQLLPFLSADLCDKVKIRLIMVLAATQDHQVIVPLICSIPAGSTAVRQSAMNALLGFRDQMPGDLSRFVHILDVILNDGVRLTFRNRLFLRDLLKKHEELDDVVKTLKQEG